MCSSDLNDGRLGLRQPPAKSVGRRIDVSVRRHQVAEPQGQAIDQDRIAAGTRDRCGDVDGGFDRAPALAPARSMMEDTLAHLLIARFRRCQIDAMADPIVRDLLSDLGLDIPPREQQTPEALAAQQKAEIEKWWPILKAANIKGE